MTDKHQIDPLLLCLETLTKIENQPVSLEALVSGLPFDPKAGKKRLFSIGNSKANFSRAARNAGFRSSLFKRKLKDIPAVVLPAILLLKDESACILTAVDQETGTAEIISPQIDDTPASVSLDTLEAQYLGFAFFLKKEYLGKRGEELATAGRDKKWWFLSTLFRFKGIYFNVLLASLFINIFVIAGPMFTMSVYDRVIPHNAIDTLWILTIGIASVYLFDIVLKFLRTYFLEVAAKKSDVILSSVLFEQCMNMKIKDRPGSVGAFANNIKEFDTVRTFLSSSVVTAFIELPFAVLFILVIYTIHPLLVLPPVLAICIALVYSLIVRGPLKKVIDYTQSAVARRNGILVESLSNLETIKAFNAASAIQWFWEESTGDIAQRSIRSRLLSTSLTTIVAFLSQVASVAVVVAGVFLIKEGELSMGGLIAVNILSGRSIAPMSQVVSLVSTFQQMTGALRYFSELMNREGERPEHKPFVRRPVFRGDIEFRGVGFSYPDETRQALTDVSLKIRAGERVGIVGPVGSGKTTLGKLLLNFYDLSGGSIFVDGIEINQIDPADLRHNIAYVPQDVSLFAGTARDNIVFKAPHAGDEEVLRAAAVGGVNVFSDKHPKGLDMQVGERGGRLSGGQRQCIAVARAFIHDTPVVLLDEPTNAMDYATETRVVRNLASATQGKTTIVITHKPSMVNIVDRLIVMEGGKIVMDGPKEKVLRQLEGGQKDEKA